ncbi:MAG: hypothetical protein QOC58_340 [Mycobacterium sp.]|nr:hypothetical protein [Mycobacterium sp.]
MNARLPADLAAAVELGGEMGRRFADFDWAAHPLGSPHGWPGEVRAAVVMALTSWFPIVLWLGRTDLFLLYNDSYAHIIGGDGAGLRHLLCGHRNDRTGTRRAPVATAQCRRIRGHGAPDHQQGGRRGRRRMCHSARRPAVHRRLRPGRRRWRGHAARRDAFCVAFAANGIGETYRLDAVSRSGPRCGSSKGWPPRSPASARCWGPIAASGRWCCRWVAVREHNSDEHSTGPTATAYLPPGSLLLLSTDDLFEWPGETLNDGFARLKSAAADCADLSVESICTELLSRMTPPGGYRDDVVVLAVRPSHSAPCSFVTVLPAAPAQIPVGRDRLREWAEENRRLAPQGTGHPARYRRSGDQRDRTRQSQRARQDGVRRGLRTPADRVDHGQRHGPVGRHGAHARRHPGQP